MTKPIKDIRESPNLSTAATPFEGVLHQILGARELKLQILARLALATEGLAGRDLKNLELTGSQAANIVTFNLT